MKSTLTLFLAALATLSILSCNKKDDSGDSNLKVKIIGTWDEQVLYTYSYVNDSLAKSDTTIREADEYHKITFRPDNTVSYEESIDGEVEQGSGTYTLSGDRLTLQGVDLEDQSQNTTIVKCQINGSQMVLSQDAKISSSSADETIELRVEVHFTKE